MEFGKLFGDVDLDQVQEVISLVTEHKDALATLSQLPEYLGRLADGLAGAGDQARSASLALVGEDGSSGVRVTLAEAGAALGSIVTSMGTIADTLGQVGEALKKLGEHLDDSGARARGFAEVG